MNSDINGTEDSIYGGRYNNGWTNLAQVNSATNSFTAGGMTSFGDFTGGEKNTFSIRILNLIALIEGFYDGSTMVSDSVTVELHNASSPYSLVDQAKLVLNTFGSGTANFFSAVDATNYYLAIKHRNSIETWSKTSQSFSGGTMIYDFTTGVSTSLRG